MVPARIILEAELDRCLSTMIGDSNPVTADRTTRMWSRFGIFAAASGVASLGEAGPTVAAAFVRSPTSDGVRPGIQTMHNRRTTVRLLFRTARRLGLVDGDPTIDLVLPPRSVGMFRPLTDEEISLCRDAAAWWMTSQRFSAVWALAESTARGGELGAVRVTDIDLDNQRVWLSGGKRVEPRWAPLTEWGRAALERRLAAVDGDEFLAYRGTSPRSAGRISAASAVTAVLTRAGLGDETDIRPSSVAAWAGRTAFDLRGDIAESARLLGTRSLDATARMIGWDWTT
jgi:integrase/recombinase XerC